MFLENNISFMHWANQMWQSHSAADFLVAADYWEENGQEPELVRIIRATANYRNDIHEFDDAMSVWAHRFEIDWGEGDWEIIEDQDHPGGYFNCFVVDFNQRIIHGLILDYFEDENEQAFVDVLDFANKPVGIQTLYEEGIRDIVCRAIRENRLGNQLTLQQIETYDPILLRVLIGRAAAYSLQS